MIGAVVLRSAVDADRHLALFRAHVPTEAITDGNLAIGGWALAAPQGHVDRARGIAWIGDLRHVPERLDVRSAPALRGCFAAIAARDGELLLARGRFGGRPLFYAEPEPGVWAVCSRMAPILTFFKRTPGIDGDVVAAMLASGHPLDETATVYHGIHRVRSGEAVRLGGRGVVERVRWGVDVAPHAPAAEDDLAEELWDTIVRSVDRALEGRRKVAVLVSGGLDSSAVLAAAIARQRSGGPEVTAITLDFEGAGDDRPYCRTLCNHLGVTPLRLDPAAVDVDLREAMTLDASPAFWPQTPLLLAMDRAARAEGCDVVLTGFGGDDLLNGDPRTFAELAWRGCPIDALHRATTLRATDVGSPLRRARNYVLHPIARRLLPAAIADRGGRSRHQGSAWLGPRARVQPRTPPMTRWVRERSRLDRASRMWAFAALIAEPRGIVEATTGCERRDPILDDDVVDFVASLPSEALLSGGFRRGLLRRALRGRVPDFVRFRLDKGAFGAAIVAHLRATGALAAVDDLASMDRLASLGAVDRGGFRSALRATLDDPAITDRRLPELLFPIYLESFAREAARGIVWLGEGWRDGLLAGRVGRRGPERVLDVPHAGMLVVPPDGAPRFEPARAADPKAIAKFRTSLEPAFVGHLAGKLALHASAVAFPGGAIACVGASGAGKSTMAAALCAHADAAILADDIVVIDAAETGTRAEGGADVCWLWPTARDALGVTVDGERKAAVTADRTASSAPLAAIVRLVFADGEPSLVPLRGREAIAAILAHVVRFPSEDATLRRDEPEQIARLVASVRVYELRRPRDLTRLIPCAEPLLELVSRRVGRGDRPRTEAR